MPDSSDVIRLAPALRSGGVVPKLPIGLARAGRLLVCLMVLLAMPLAGRAQETAPIATRSLAPSAKVSLPDSMARRRIALVIGNAAYKSAAALKNPANDARDMCALLAKAGFEADCRFDLKDRDAMRDAVRNFASKLSPETVAFFYYAGHAVQIRGENFMLPVSINPKSILDIEDEGLGLNYLLRALDEVRSSPNIVVLDACRSNPFSDNYRLKLDRGLARVDPPVGTVLVYATAPGQEALDGNHRNGLFTESLLKYLAAPGLTLGESLELASRDVEREARTRYGFTQIPYRSFSYSGNFCLAGCNLSEPGRVLASLRAQEAQANQRIAALEAQNARLVQALQAGASQAGLDRTTGTASDVELRQLRAELKSLQAQAAKLEATQRTSDLTRSDAKRSNGIDSSKDPALPRPSRPVIVPSF